MLEMCPASADTRQEVCLVGSSIMSTVMEKISGRNLKDGGYPKKVTRVRTYFARKFNIDYGFIVAQ